MRRRRRRSCRNLSRSIGGCELCGGAADGRRLMGGMDEQLDAIYPSAPVFIPTVHRQRDDDGPRRRAHNRRRRMDWTGSVLCGVDGAAAEDEKRS